MYKITVVLPTFNRIDQLKKVIEGLENQTFNKGDFEVIVVSDGSSDGTNEYLQQVDTPLNLRPIIQENQGVAATRNNGYAHAKGDIILFIDDDVVPERNLLTQHYNSHLEAGLPENLILIGPMLSPPDYEFEPWVQWEQAMLYKQYDAMDRGVYEPTARQFYTGNSSIPLNFLKRSGGFDTTFSRAEDVELAYRLAKKGARFAFNNEAIGYHYAKRSFESWQKTPYLYGRNDVIFSEKRGQSWLVPAIMEEYQYRHRLVRLVNRICLDRPLVSRFTQLASRVIAGTAHKLGITALSNAGYSVIFNIRHYQGMSDELGGRKRFFQLVETHR